MAGTSHSADGERVRGRVRPADPLAEEQLATHLQLASFIPASHAYRPLPPALAAVHHPSHVLPQIARFHTHLPLLPPRLSILILRPLSPRSDRRDQQVRGVPHLVELFAKLLSC